MSAANLTTEINRYLSFFAATSSSHTAKAKRSDLQKFQKFMTTCYGPDLILEDWTNAATNTFLEALLQAESPASAARRLATLKHFGRQLTEWHPGYQNPAKAVKSPKIATNIPKALSADEVDRIKAKALAQLSADQGFATFRNQVIFLVLLETGLRADEVRLLRFKQLSEQLDWLENIRTKGKRYRNVYLADQLRPVIRDYLQRRQTKLQSLQQGPVSRQLNQQLPVFISTYRATLADPQSLYMSPKTLWRAINQLSSTVALHPHLLRHTFALDLLKSSGDIRLVSQALGHGDVKITMRYTERSDQEIAAAIEAKNS